MKILKILKRYIFVPELKRRIIDYKVDSVENELESKEKIIYYSYQ